MSPLIPIIIIIIYYYYKRQIYPAVSEASRTGYKKYNVNTQTVPPIWEAEE